jgi:hypothetical protein
MYDQKQNKIKRLRRQNGENTKGTRTSCGFEQCIGGVCGRSETYVYGKDRFLLCFRVYIKLKISPFDILSQPLCSFTQIYVFSTPYHRDNTSSWSLPLSVKLNMFVIT